MSHKMMAAAMRATLDDPATKLVLLALASYADQEGRCWPSVETLAGMCCCAESEVRSAIKELERLELVKVDRIPGSVSAYRLLLGRR